MKDFFSQINQKNKAIWLIAFLLLVYKVLVFLSIVAAPYSIADITSKNVDISVSEYQRTFQNYINDESAKLKILPDSLKTIVFHSLFLTLNYIIFSPFLGSRKRFAKYVILNLVLIEIFMDIFIGIKYKILPSKISIMVVVFMLMFLFSSNINKAFGKDN